ncbi:MAG: hypothetical protein OEU54_12760 [Gemmatimonadota bacterium]|nr:hypothetical protein [Gemmatimonadota bacterium]
MAAGIPPHVSGFDPNNTFSLLVSGLFVYMGDFLGLAPSTVVRIVGVATLGVFNGLVGALLYRATGNFVRAHSPPR